MPVQCFAVQSRYMGSHVRKLLLLRRQLPCILVGFQWEVVMSGRYMFPFFGGASLMLPCSSGKDTPDKAKVAKDSPVRERRRSPKPSGPLVCGHPSCRYQVNSDAKAGCFFPLPTELVLKGSGFQQGVLTCRCAITSAFK